MSMGTSSWDSDGAKVGEPGGAVAPSRELGT